VTVACNSSEAVAPLTAKDRFRVATTTSLYDTGLWALLEPRFEDRYDVEMDILYAGTGKALEYGTRGDVDAVVVHARSSEEKFIADGYGMQRYPFAYNYFLIVGPASDPAGIKGMAPEDAFKHLVDMGKANPGSVNFVSRGDESGTHVKEKAIWKSAGYTYEDVQKSGEWYIEAGTGMGPTLVMAKEKSAYTLADIGTYLAFKKDLGLEVMVEEGDILLNVYSIIAVNPEKAKVDNEMADNLIKYLVSDEIQDLIGKYGAKEYGRSLFEPCSGATVCK
jgi:tungstate transport system substrate-binding protein